MRNSGLTENLENLTMNNVEDFNRSAASGQSDAKLYVMLNTGVGGAIYR